MNIRLTVLALLVLLAASASADPIEVGYTSEPGLIEGGGLDECTGTLVYNHDEDFENGYAWSYGGVAPPYYGAFAEGYMLGGNAIIECIAMWLCDEENQHYAGQTCDVYIWDGGVTAPPGNVLLMMPGFDPGPPAIWPNVSQHDADIPDYGFSGDELTVGAWGDWPEHPVYAGWFVAADIDGSGGHPWVCVEPGIGYGSGWSDPSIVWGSTNSMGYGFYYSISTPTHSSTWGAVKSLFQ